MIFVRTYFLRRLIKVRWSSILEHRDLLFKGKQTIDEAWQEVMRNKPGSKGDVEKNESGSVCLEGSLDG